MNYTTKWPAMAKTMLISLVAVGLLAGCGKQAAAPQGPQAVAVKAVAVTAQDTVINYEFVGEVLAREEVQIKATVSGNLAAKMVSGGATVVKGQPLFQIDRRQYEASFYNYQASLAEAEASLSRIRRDLARYQSLAGQQAIAQQVLDNALAEEQQAAARVQAARMKVQQANNDLGDTVVVAPMDGKIDMKDPSVGAYIQAGQTVLATISSADPMQVKFSISENEYLNFTRKGVGSPADWKSSLKLRLSDGSVYPLTGKVEQVDRGISSDTGSLTVKAVFPNPDKLLVPGMFARVIADGETRSGAILIPERAVQEMLGKTFVTVVAEGDKAELRPVKMGPRLGQNWLVEEGIKPGERIVVEGFMKAQPGAQLQVTMIGPEELKSNGQKK